ncbi:uncharacterized mitochondrial protein AtMg00810-like [Cornus florida]|uniref:uncharacterized mitochondrial protein AtMg00810-like n=1 Tax=Cornus florida TaxID=4283 RepID=UPI0028A282B4|nr:uncharacterized mitochondrial protein AtMg00810-like [Cornus florida]
MEDELQALHDNHTWELVPRLSDINIVGSKWVYRINKADSSLFIYRDNNFTTILLIYVDDIFVAGNNDTFITNLLTQLGHEFVIKDLGSLLYFLGVEIRPFSSGIFLSQKKYIHDLFTRTKMLDSSPIATPMIIKEKSAYSNVDQIDTTVYRSIVGALQYLTFTRPDIIHVVNRVCQHFNNPTLVHIKAVKRILQYLKGTQHFGLCYLSQSSSSLYGSSDVDWAGCPITRRSTTGFCVFFGANCVSWCSKKQPTVARSSSEKSLG